MCVITQIAGENGLMSESTFLLSLFGMRKSFWQNQMFMFPVVQSSVMDGTVGQLTAYLTPESGNLSTTQPPV